jgi:hypothetical protein
MFRLSYAKFLIEVDLLSTLPTTINIVMPNGMPLLQSVVLNHSLSSASIVVCLAMLNLSVTG